MHSKHLKNSILDLISHFGKIRNTNLNIRTDVLFQDCDHYLKVMGVKGDPLQ